MGKFMNGDKMYGTDLTDIDQLTISSPGYFINLDASGGSTSVCIGQGDPDDIDYENCTYIFNDTVSTNDILKQYGEGTWGNTDYSSLNSAIESITDVTNAIDVNEISEMSQYIDTLADGNISASDNYNAISYVKDLSGYMTVDSSGNITMDNSLSVGDISTSGDIYKNGYWTPDTSIEEESLVNTLGSIVDDIDQLTTDVGTLQSDVSTLQGQTYTYERTATSTLRDDQSVSITDSMNNVLDELSDEISRLWSSIGYYIPH